MKKIVIVLDGVADRKNIKLNNQTPLEFASTPNLDILANRSILGCVNTIPKGLEIGSAVANLSLLGFDPRSYNGRAVIEAAGVGLKTKSDNLYIRTNFVNFEGADYLQSKIKNYSAYDIPTEISKPLTDLLNEKVFNSRCTLHNVGTFRNILEVDGGRKLYPINLAPAHDIIGRPINQYLSESGNEQIFYKLQEKAYNILKNNGSSANGIWFWGASIEPEIPFNTKKRCVLSETILMKGITAIAKIDNIETDDSIEFEKFLDNKLKLSVEALKNYNDVYIHIQKTDDLSHDCEPQKKADAIEKFDELFLPKLLSSINDDFCLIITSDHYTFSDDGSHGGESVPFLLYNSKKQSNSQSVYTEASCRENGLIISSEQLLQMMD